MDDEEYEKLTYEDVGLGPDADRALHENQRRAHVDQNELHTFDPEPFDPKHCATCWPFKRRKGHSLHA